MPRISHGTVVAYLALFIALGGVGYAAATGSIDSREIKNSTIRSKDLRNNDVRGTDIRRDTVKGTDVDESSLGTVPRAGAADSAANAGTLNGLRADQLVRTARADKADVLPPDTSGQMLTTTITAPAPGFLTIIGSVEAIYPATGTDQVECFFEVNGTKLANSERVLQINGTAGTEDNCSTNATRPVAAGPHKIDFELTNVNNSDFAEGELSVIYTRN
jgi:hypothetical protein